MPLLFAVTLFTSASLLFMVQPMVGKMVLPLLGGSPAVWNACMVFFQALLLLGYLYAHKLVSIESPRKQWMIHLSVLALPLTVFALAAVFSARHSPIAIVEALAPTDERSPILSVLAILTVAIGIPFFVISTTATLLQRWFVYTGHPSARDPYFLYAASNFGSLISLLGYPLVIEPRMTIVAQAWVFAVGFATLAGLIFLCGRAAANPIGVPPPSARPNTGKKQAVTKAGADAAPQPAAASEPPPTLARQLKWVALAFVPSTLMLGVTFHITTDIASVPLLWVAPLSLYLITFIVAFGRVPDWFRVVIGNLAPVMILLLVFVLISGVDPGYGVKLLLHITTFFAAAMMCHYELARDRPAPEHLTGFFLLMSVGGVLGGIFNSLVAPLVFPHTYEYPIALVVACLMVPKLLGDDAEKEKGEARPAAPPVEPEAAPKTVADRVVAWLPFVGVVLNSTVLIVGLFWLYSRGTKPISLSEGSTLDPRTLFWVAGGLLLAGVASLAAVEWQARSRSGKKWSVRDLWDGAPVPARAGALALANPLALPWAVMSVTRTKERLNLYLDFVVPVVVGVGFFVLAMLTNSTWFDATARGISERVGLPTKTITIVVVYAVPVMLCFFFVDRPLRFALCVLAVLGPTTYIESSGDNVHSERSFFGILKVSEDESYQFITGRDENGEATRLKNPDGSLMIAGSYQFRKLTHGTTLHGQQVSVHNRHFLDDFQMLNVGMNPWDTLAVSGAIQTYDARQEPLTYYHRTGPVGAAFSELRRRKGGADANAHFAMIGLGTGSVSCYARPGQKLTFYEIDPAVKHLVADTDQWFTYVRDARNRGADVEFLMGDARLKLKRATDHKYTLLLVDAFSSDSIPVHLLTVEAVQLYLDRMTDDGILALHISNRWVNLEPVCARIAAELGLTARVWNDGAERRPGKTASSWVILARKPEHLGDLYQPLGDLTFGPPAPAGEDDRPIVAMEHPLYLGLAHEFDDLRDVGTKKAKYKEFNELPGPQVDNAWINWIEEQLGRVKLTDAAIEALRTEAKVPAPVLDKLAALKNKLYWTRQPFEDELARVLTRDEREAWEKAVLKQADKPARVTDPFQRKRLETYMDLITRFTADTTFADAMVRDHGHAFRRLETFAQVAAWTDDYSDVMRVMIIPGLQKVRKFFGLPAPLER